MRKSIKWKFTIAFILLIVCIIGSIILFNTLFLERLYINNKKNVLKTSYSALESGIIEEYERGQTLEDLFKNKRTSNGELSESSLTYFLRELQEVYGVSTVLMDSNNKTYSLFQSSSRFDRRMMDYIFKDAANNKNLEILEKNNNYTIAINKGLVIHLNNIRGNTSDSGPTEFYENKGPGTNDRPSNKISPPVSVNNNSYLECFGFLSDNQTAFFLTIPIESIKEPIDLFNKVLIVVSIVALIIGSIAIFLLSNSLTKPLLELANISKKMSRLEFENKYTGSSQDEIGILGESMNEMSYKLEKSIKELKNANYKLKKDLEKKEELDLMRQEFVANVSHELKTPISLIKGYVEGLETNGIVDSKEKRDYYLSVIKDETDKMGSMVRQLLDLASLERGMEELEILRINLKDVALGVINSFNIKLKDKNIRIDIDIDDNTFIWTDGYKLEEVLRNYISNAINHIDDNKRIIITSSDLNNSYVRLNVFNSGIQLSDEDLVKIWDKFYKVDKAHTRSYGGTGLGLSIVKAIAKQLNTNCGCINTTKDGMNGIEFYFDFSLD